MPSLAIKSGPGYALLPASPQVSPAAALLRVAALNGNPDSHYLPAPRHVPNQNDVPCCVSCALGAAMEILNPNLPKLAPLFHYHLTRFERGGADGQGFLFISDALTVLEARGICRLALHPFPFTLADANHRPSEEALADGRRQRLEPRPPFLFPRTENIKLDSRVVDIRNQLRRGHPVILAFRIPVGYEQFIDEQQQWTDPLTSTPSNLGHCVVAIGYDDARQALRIQDSQGECFADGGRWWMGYRVVDSSFVQQAFYLTP